jgi:prepilin signal peptidase PulO-like enzyme (type II secretory pathway)
MDSSTFHGAIAPLVSSYLGLCGLLVGSFVNLAADRLPRGESIVSPPSHCRSCGRRLNALDLLPVAGYLIRRGRCASCGVPIGVSTLVVEAVSGAAVIVPLVWLGLWPGALVGLVLLALCGAAIVWLSMRPAAFGRASKKRESQTGTGSDFAPRAR